MLTIRKTGSQEYGRHIKALIVGAPGSGKTLTSSTWPYPIYASAEAGLMSVASRNVPYVDIKTSADLAELRIRLDGTSEERQERFGFPVETVVIDTIDEIQKILMREKMEETRKEVFELRDWGWLGEQMRALVRGFRNMDMNVVFTCHVKESKDDELGRIYYAPSLQGAFGDEIPSFVDLALVLKTVLATEIIDDKTARVTHRFFQTYADRQYPWIKDRSGTLPQEFEVNFKDDFQRLHDFIYGAKDALPDSEEIVVSGAIGESSEDDPVLTLTQEVESTQEIESNAETVEGIEPGYRFTPDCPKGKSSCKIDDNQADLSRIRFRKVLCRECFVEEKGK